MLVRFEEYGGVQAGYVQAADEGKLHWRYPLKPLCAQALMPVPHKAPDEAAAVAEYKALWAQMLPADGDNGGVGRIPKSHRASWPLWLDHFDTLWQTVAQAIPSATAFGTRPDVSLYDHSKSTAAFAVALWRYYHDSGANEAEVVQRLHQRKLADEQPFLLVQGDFSGIQSFIFGGNASVQKKAARLLRGRSAFVSLLSELAALKLLDAMALPPTSLVSNAAGKFLIVAPNSQQAREAVRTARQEMADWLVANLFGLASITIVGVAAAEEDFTVDGNFARVQARLRSALELKKRRPFDLCGANAPDPVRATDYRHGACRFDNRLPAAEGVAVDGEAAHPVSAAAIELGRALADPALGRLLIFREGQMPPGLKPLPTAIFGYQVVVTGDQQASGNFGDQAGSGALVRAYDTALATDAVMWNGYARRPLSAYAATHRYEPAQDKRYDRLDGDAKGEKGRLKTFEHLALDDRQVKQNERGEWVVGVEALGVLKGDIDDLGAMFQANLHNRPSFARTAELSRRINAFFTIWVPALCERESDFHNIYTVFAGGDDFFFIGPWLTLRRFARRLQQDFARYVAGNGHIHFSAGYVMAKPGFPIRQLAMQADWALGEAKKRQGAAADDRKNALFVHGAAIGWADWGEVDKLDDAVAHHTGKDELSTQFIYGLLHLLKMREDSKHPESARWRSRLFYQTRRYFERQERDRDMREPRSLALIKALGEQGIAERPQALRVALTEHIYRLRD